MFPKKSPRATKRVTVLLNKIENTLGSSEKRWFLLGTKWVQGTYGVSDRWHPVVTGNTGVKPRKCVWNM